MQKTNPPMIANGKVYTKKPKKLEKLYPRVNGKSKVIQTKSHEKAYR